MKRRVMPITLMAMAAAAMEAGNLYFMTERRYRQQRDADIRRRCEDDAAMRALCYECRKEYEFSIHGEKITAHSRKEAIKKYNTRHRK